MAAGAPAAQGPPSGGQPAQPSEGGLLARGKGLALIPACVIWGAALIGGVLVGAVTDSGDGGETPADVETDDGGTATTVGSTVPATSVPPGSSEDFGPSVPVTPPTIDREEIEREAREQAEEARNPGGDDEDEGNEGPGSDPTSTSTSTSTTTTAEDPDETTPPDTSPTTQGPTTVPAPP
jgi:hypothetical protein